MIRKLKIPETEVEELDVTPKWGAKRELKAYDDDCWDEYVRKWRADQTAELREEVAALDILMGINASMTGPNSVRYKYVAFHAISEPGLTVIRITKDIDAPNIKFPTLPDTSVRHADDRTIYYMLQCSDPDLGVELWKTIVKYQREKLLSKIERIEKQEPKHFIVNAEVKAVYHQITE